MIHYQLNNNFSSLLLKKSFYEITFFSASDSHARAHPPAARSDTVTHRPPSYPQVQLGLKARVLGSETQLMDIVQQLQWQR
jgi:hypothetical protein